MSGKPPSVEKGFRDSWSTVEDMPVYYAPRHEARTFRLLTGNLTTDGVQRSGFTSSSGTPSSNQIFTVSTATITWPGLDGFYADELEAGLTCGLRSSSGTSGTTIGFRWELKNSTGSTWQAMHSTYKKVKAGTSTDVERTFSGYASLGLGYNKLPLHIRLRAFARQKGKLRIKNSSYVAIKVKKSS